MHFPKDFMFGVATSAAQVEGGGFEDGRSPSIWDVYADKPGKIQDGAKPSVACDSYHLFDKDLENLKNLGVNSYRMSISWSRVMPDGIGRLNQKGVDYYKRCFEKLMEAGIAPNVTLYHWDLPQILEEKGGWVNRDSQYWFSEYADKMFRAYGDIVPYWATVNEPIATYVGYGQGWFAPGHSDRLWGNQARHNVMTASGAGVEAFRASGAKGKIGVVIDVWMRYPLTDSPEDAALAKDENEENWKFYCDRLLGHGYSEYILDKFAKEGSLPIMYDEDFRLTDLPLDFYGMNYYNTFDVGINKAAGEEGGIIQSTESHPENAGRILRTIRDMYDLKIPIIITENGTRDKPDTKTDENGIMQDDSTIKYLEATLRSIGGAIAEGVDVRGYYVWSLMDNFEWVLGNTGRVGLFHTDFDTMERTCKKSGYWYHDFIKKAQGR